MPAQPAGIFLPITLSPHLTAQTSITYLFNSPPLYILFCIYVFSDMGTMNLQADDFYSALSHPMRLRAVILIKQMDELCVCELTHALDLVQPVISRHLAQLKEAGVLLARKQGLWVYYRINDALPIWALDVIQTTHTGVANLSPYQNDRQALCTMADRPNQACC